MIKKKLYKEDLILKSNKFIDWYKNKGNYVRFEYGDIKGKLLIKDVYKKGCNYRIIINYNNKDYDIGSSGLLNCDIGLFLKHINLSDELYKRWDSLRKQHIKTEFFLSEDKTYWIGKTLENDEFWFDGDEETIKYIKSFTWRKEGKGYIQNNKGDKLHRIVMGITDSNIFINHLGRNTCDNRRNMLSISNSLDNSREKKVSNSNHSGIVGLLKRGNKWVGNIKINDISIYSKYKEKDEALIDLLIMQKHYGFRHNEDKYYLLKNITEERIKEVIDNCERQLHKKRNDKICSSNKFELSDDGTYYNVYDEKGESFKIDIESLEKVKQGIWHVAHDISNGNISVHGSIINNNGKRIVVKLHRYLLELLDKKYNKWFVVNDNQDRLDNRLNNLTITDSVGAGLSKKCEHGYQKRNDGYRVLITILGKKYRGQFKTKQEAIDFIKDKREYGFKNRLQFKTKEELDYYLNNISKEVKYNEKIRFRK